MSVNLRFSNWLREFLCKTNYLSALEESIMTKAKEQAKTERVKERLDTEMKKIDKEINERLNPSSDIQSIIKNYNNFDLVFGLLPIPILHEIYLRLEEGSRAIEENKRIKAALDNVNEAIKKMFNLV
jgi:hypothetical protein